MDSIKEDVFEKMDDINYIPVVNGGILAFASPAKTLPNGKNISFITKSSIFKYKKFLINPYHNEKGFKELYESNSLIPNSLVFADSGGLQELLLSGVTKSPEEILRWQEKYSDIGFSLDKIPFKQNTGSAGNKVGWTFDILNFDNCANETKDRISRAMAVRTKYKTFKFYAIIQGTKYDEYLQWKNIIDQKGIDGWCCKSPTNDPANLAETAAFVLEKLDKPVHFLGVGNLTKSIILIYMKKYFKHKISFDSSSYDTGSQFRAYNSPFAFNYITLILSGESLFTSFDFCLCPACDILTQIITDKEKDNMVGPLISIHNLILNINIINYLSKIYNDGEKMRTFVKSYFKGGTAKKLIEIFDFIDDVNKHTFKEARRKWDHIFTEYKKSTKQQTLF